MVSFARVEVRRGPSLYVGRVGILLRFEADAGVLVVGDAFLANSLAVEEVAQPEPKPAEDKIFDVVEQQPTFKEGDVRAWLARNMQYPPVAAENGIQGRVVVGFVVERDGSISHVQILRGVDPSLDKEAMRVVKSMPKWNPGMQNGSPVRVKYNVPVQFKLQ